MPDYRSERSPSPDGQGKAKSNWARAWDTYVEAVKPVSKLIEPALMPLFTRLAQGKTFDLIGFWVAWHTCGGFEGLQKNLGMSRSGVYRRVSAFRSVFGEHPDAFVFPGLTIDVSQFVETVARDTPKS